MRSWTAAEVAQLVGGEVVGDRALRLTGFATPDQAKVGDLVFAENAAYLAKAEQSAASAIIASAQVGSASKTLIRVADPRVAFARALPVLFPEPAFAPGRHASAVIAASAQIDPTAHIGPFCVVGERVQIGARCVLEAGDHLGADARLGDDVRLFPNVVIYPRSQIGHRVRLHAGVVIGSDGFGYVLDNGVQRKVPQIGIAIIEDDVEIGANSTVDRAALGATVIGRGTKVDNLVQVGHNVTIGAHSIVCGQVGLAGSTRVGERVTLAGQVGVSGHLQIGRGAIVGAQAGVIGDVPEGARWTGTPARPEFETKRGWVALTRLPELLRRVSDLEKRVHRLSGEA